MSSIRSRGLLLPLQLLGAGMVLSAAPALAQDAAPPVAPAADSSPSAESSSASEAAPPAVSAPAAEPSAAPAPGASAVTLAIPAETAPAEHAAAASGPATTLGGYGELHYNYAKPERGRSAAELDLHRLVFFLGHEFGGGWRFHAEVELEHAAASADLPGEVSVEQAYLEYQLLDEVLALRAGVVLVPMGIVNPEHEPPTFNGVERPLVDRRVIPSTWREAGVGVVGKPLEGLRYELYLVGGLDAGGFDAIDGIRGGRTDVAEATANAFAVTGRAEYEPRLGTKIGVSGYFGEAGPNAELERADGSVLRPEVPVLGLAADARSRLGGLELRGVFATFSIGDAKKLNDSVDEDGARRQVGSRILGYYVEAGYDVMQHHRSDQALVPFVRYEVSDTLAAVPEGAFKTTVGRAAKVRDVVMGVTYRPIPQVALKGDVILREPDGATRGNTLVDLGVGYMF